MNGALDGLGWLAEPWLLVLTALAGRAAALLDSPISIQYNLVSGTDEWGGCACTGSSTTSAGSPTRRC